MTIQEAIKSGKPFRRPIWIKDVWIIIKNLRPYYCEGLRDEDYMEPAKFTVPDVLADDWKVKP